MHTLRQCLSVFLLLGFTAASAETSLTLSRNTYKEKLQGFWLGQCIANWTGLVKIGRAHV